MHAAAHLILLISGASLMRLVTVAAGSRRNDRHLELTPMVISPWTQPIPREREADDPAPAALVELAGAVPAVELFECSMDYKCVPIMKLPP